MKIQSSNTKRIYEFDPGKIAGEVRHTCPECSHLRKKSKDKCFAWDINEKRGFCHNCLAAFFEYKPYSTEKEYVIPEWRNKTDLTDEAVKYFESRMISQKTLNKMRVYSDVEFMPQFGKVVKVICFPMFVGDKLINIKYRGPKKSFKLVSGAELVWFNFNSIQNSKELIIVEGEIDALSWVECGYDNVISVPNGANKNLEYLDNSIKLFDHLEKIFIATDADTKGIELRDELIRRFGPERCYLVNFQDCKDSNEFLLKHTSEFKSIIDNAKPVPVSGIVSVDDLYSDIIDLYENGITPGAGIQIHNIDQYITWELSRLAIVTGIPGSGKSEFVDYLVLRLNMIHGWKAAYFTPENYPLKFHYAKLHEKVTGRQFKNNNNDAEFSTAYEYIRDNFFYIMNEEDMTVKSVLESAKGLVRQRGVKILVIDPYNKLEHQAKTGESETQYISKFLDQLVNFARFNKVLVFLVAHPTKLKSGDVPTLYDISGSANFYNKCDYGFTVHREKDDNGIMVNQVKVYWQKIKFKHLGTQGISDLMYNYSNGRFEQQISNNNFPSVDQWDNANWLMTPQREIEPDYWFQDKAEPPF